MHNYHLIQAALVLTASALPPHSHYTPREEIHVDVIRYLKCANLVTIKDDGGWEMGMAAYYADKAITGTGVTADNRAIFDMYTDMMDVFFNNKGRVYGADTSVPGDSLWADFMYTPEMANDYDMPPEGIFIGHAERKVGDQRWGYNCFVDRDWPDFIDDNYGKCRSFVRCEQRDALRLYVKATEDTTRAQDMSKPADIWAKFSERYDTTQRLCDTSPVSIDGNSDCKVTFDCGDNSEEGKVMDTLIKLMGEYANSNTQAFKEEEVQENQPACIAGSCSSREPNRYTYRSMPKSILFMARSVPSSDGREGGEIAHLKATVECAADPGNEALCMFIKALFGAAGAVPAAGAVAAIGGAAAEIGCGVTA